MLTTYENAVVAAIEYFATSINGCAHDSVAEKNDYGIFDSVDCIQWLMYNYTKYDNAQALASAALASSLDTAVRENIHAQLT